MVDRLQGERSPDRRALDRRLSRPVGQPRQPPGRLRDGDVRRIAAPPGASAPWRVLHLRHAGRHAGGPVDRHPCTRLWRDGGPACPSLRPERGRSYFLHRFAGGCAARRGRCSSPPCPRRCGDACCCAAAASRPCASPHSGRLRRHAPVAGQQPGRTAAGAGRTGRAGRGCKPIAVGSRRGRQSGPLCCRCWTGPRDMPFAGVPQASRTGLDQAGALGEISRTTYRQASAGRPVAPPDPPAGGTDRRLA